MPDNNFIRLALPYTDEDEINEIRGVLASGYLTQGPKVAEFEEMIRAKVGTKYAFAMSSCTTALHLSLVVLGVGPGDEVLVPDFTFPATANVVVQQGATPVLIDIHLNTFAIDVEDAARKVTPRTKAIMPMHPFGLSADMDAILALAEKHGLKVVEDAATAIGTTYKGRFCGSMGDLGCFSFHPRKVITTGEGGMIVTNNDQLAEKIALLRSHGGIRRSGRYIFEEAGFNYRLSDVQGAIGVAQMRKLDALIARKRELAAQLTEKLAAVDGVKVPREPIWGGHIYQSYVVLLEDEINRDGVIAAMREHGIETTLGTYALHVQPFFMRGYGYGEGDLPNSYRAYRQTLTLPLYPPMGEAELDRVALALNRAVEIVH
ncbi:DegT/DnrJ/EryC1/StrS family aminotransferase [Candidatus Bipolaricaulota bacterium]|nr:DegT/DnrJ/EryC1/StrS family aminotransferase [Candidatus Bipolaricaulota bacterium]